ARARPTRAQHPALPRRHRGGPEVFGRLLQPGDGIRADRGNAEGAPILEELRRARALGHLDGDRAASPLSLDFGLARREGPRPKQIWKTDSRSARSDSSAIASTTGAKAAERREGSAFPDKEARKSRRRTGGGNRVTQRRR